MIVKDDTYYIREAIKEAKKAYLLDEVPVGCVIVKDDKIIARSHNLRNSKKNSLYHAEILAINKACKKLNRWILDDCKIYVTMEPCIMCSGAILQARIKEVIYGLKQDRYGCVDSMMHLFTDYNFNNTPIVRSGILEDEIRVLVQDFFKEMRLKKEKIKRSEVND